MTDVEDTQDNAPYHVCGWPPELEDALHRLNQANADFESLGLEINRFHYEYVKGMVRNLGPEGEAFTVQLRHPNDSYVRGRPAVLVAQIAENLRAALDYSVFQLSKLNAPSLNERAPAFVIADSRQDFENNAKAGLRYLTTEQVDLIEQLQPYNGNLTLSLVRDITNPAKHRHLLRMLDLTSLEVHLASLDKQSEEYRDWFVYPAGDGEHAIFARFKEQPRLQLLEQYNAFEVLGLMISQTDTILWAFSHCFCPNHGHLPKFNIEYGKSPPSENG
ncbi:MAG: hypothetical protein OYI31_08385 [Chloroflexota bacterium]|nr:hypothetical protein [Chloroflexota bacterium]